MIELTLIELALTLVSATGLLVAGSHLVFRGAERRARKELRKAALSCRVCGHSWYEPGAEEIVSCPHCKRKVQRGASRHLG